MEINFTKNCKKKRCYFPVRYYGYTLLIFINQSVKNFAWLNQLDVQAQLNIEFFSVLVKSAVFLLLLIYCSAIKDLL